MILAETNYPGVYGYQHILYLLISLTIIIGGNILITKKVHSEKLINLIVKISGFILLSFILFNRISITYIDVIINKREGYTFLNLIPNTFCGLSSLVFSLAIIFGKKDNKVLHFITYIGFLGGILTTFYPYFLEDQTFFDVRTISGLLHHSAMLWVAVLIINTGYLKPTIKKWFYYPIGLSFMMVFGLFQIECLKFNSAMQIGKPLLKSLPIFTSWYVVGILSIILQLIFLISFEHFKNKKSFKEIFN